MISDGEITEKINGEISDEEKEAVENALYYIFEKYFED